MIEVDFGEGIFDSLTAGLRPGEALSAAAVLTVLDEAAQGDAWEAVSELEVPLDISDLPRFSGTGELAQRLHTEQKLAKEGRLLTGLEENDPLRLYLEEMAAIPVCGDEDVLAQELYEANLAGKEDPQLCRRLLNLSLSRVVEIAGEFTGCGVQLLDLIQEGSMGLWQALPRLTRGDFAPQRDGCIRQAMKKTLILQAYENGVGQKMRQAMEDYRSVDEKLLLELGRNPTQEEIAQALHITPEEAASVADKIESARLLSRVQTQPQPDPQEEERPVEDTAYFQMRQRIQELLSVLNEQDARLLTLRFGLEGGLPKTPQQTAALLGLTAEEVVAREAAALAKLRNE